MSPCLLILAVAALICDSKAFFLSHDAQQVSRGRFASIGKHKRRATSHFASPRTTSYTTSSSRITEATAAAVSGSTVELIEPETGSHVILLGCFHGSQSSAADVSACITNDTNVVCMELCASRFTDLRRDFLQDQEEAKWSSSSSSSSSPSTAVRANNPQRNKKKKWIFRFTEMVQKKVQSRGWSTGIAAALLGGVSGMQTALSGLDPGLEFRRALEEVHYISLSSNDTLSCDIVLADQCVDETLQKVGQLPSLAVAMWKDCLKQGWASSFGLEASALKTALAGSSSSNNNNEQQVTIWKFLTRNQAAVRDMVRLVLPPVLLLQTLAWNTHDPGYDWLFQAVQQDYYPVADAAVAASDFAVMAEDVMMAVTLFAANWLVLFLGYVSVALPVARVVLRERDDTLASGIRQACQMAEQQQQQQQQSKGETQGTPIRVVAVLGFLHVNGVAERLLRQQQNDGNDSVTSPEI